MEDIIDKFYSGEIEGEVKDLLGLNNVEWTAICHALDLKTLADWRRQGWPNKCSILRL